MPCLGDREEALDTRRLFARSILWARHHRRKSVSSSLFPLMIITLTNTSLFPSIKAMCRLAASRFREWTKTYDDERPLAKVLLARFVPYLYLLKSSSFEYGNKVPENTTHAKAVHILNFTQIQS